MITLEQLTDTIAKITMDYLKTAQLTPAAIIRARDNSNKTVKSESSANQSKGTAALPERQVISEGAGNSVAQLLNKKLIVEEDIRLAVKKNCAVIEVSKSALITPAAKDMILHKKLKLIKK